MYKKTLQLTSGRGPVECEWAVAQILKHLIQEINIENLNYKIIERTSGTLHGTLQTACLELYGEKELLNQFICSWLGVIQYIGQSPFRKFHKRKNWFIEISEVSELKEINILETDIKYQAVRSQGPGGQKVNKVNTAVRATHLPTKTSVFVMDSRSQFQNKKTARDRLIEKIKLKNYENLKSQIQEKWNHQTDIQRGNPIRVFTHKY